MANSTISQLPQALALLGNEYMEAVQAGVSVRVTPQQIANFSGTQAFGFVVKPASTSLTNQGVLTPDPDLTTPLATGTYILEVGLNVSSNGGGWQGNLAFSGVILNPTIFGFACAQAYPGLIGAQIGNSLGWNVTNSQFNTNGNPYMFTAQLSVLVTSAGTLTYNSGQSTSNAGATTTCAGSYIRYQKIA
jgi:hypothetical protein